MTDPYKAYLCPECDNEHDSEAGALTCCAPRIPTVWVCDSCGDHYDFEVEARECCAEDEEEESEEESE